MTITKLPPGSNATLPPATPPAIQGNPVRGGDEAEKRGRSAPSQPARGATNTSQAKVRQQFKKQRSPQVRKQFDDFAKQYKASNAYENLHARYASKFPEIGPPDGTPIGMKLSNLPGPQLTKADLRPGDILVVYEPASTVVNGKPEVSKVRPNRQITITRQFDDHNGIPHSCNQGDHRNVHNAIYVHTPGNPQATKAWGAGEPEVVEGRAARDWVDEKTGKLTPINRVQPAAISMTECNYSKIYRPRDANVGNAMAQIGMVMASGHVTYATKEMRTAATDNYPHFDKAAKKAAVQVAEDAFNPTPRWAQNPVNMHDNFKTGVNCISFVVRAAQSAKLQVLQQTELFKGNPPPALEDLVEHKEMTGVFGISGSHVSVRSFEHFLLHATDPDGSPQFEFVGKLEMKHGDVMYDEALPPMEAAQLPPLPETHPHSVEYQEKLRNEKQAANPSKAKL